MQVQYVGDKAEKVDHLYGTNAVWRGHGDVQDVPDDAAKRMAAHYDVWQIVAAAAVRDAAGVVDEVAEVVADVADEPAIEQEPVSAPAPVAGLASVAVKRGPGRPRKSA